MTGRAEVISQDPQDVVLYDRAMFPNLIDQDPQQVMLRLASRFQKAQSVDDLFGALGGNSTKDMIGRKLRIISVAWAPFQSDRGIIPNAICEAVDLDSGEALEFATTGMTTTMFIRQAELIGALPVDVRIASVKTKDGNNAINFERP